MSDETGAVTEPTVEATPTGSTTGSWRDMIGAAKQRAKELTTDQRTQEALAKATASAQSASHHLDVTRRRITQEESWAEVTVAIEELVQVSLAQQQLIEGLVARVQQLEEGHSRA
ncbi:hypothetical protein ISU10_22105 [Nocardioides agariphilus]|jgi:hypothetical protein|uniref:Uncharacterized protein n=1 Tax=Nocardioides agariphilus TaxID=433664 RepID=A0A930VRG5_9ACTN|nr:hypothetical protein [Nocardioides agariphilus]MBF4770476.1 hypothetical protein [Nocardioides agariphilus]